MTNTQQAAGRWQLAELNDAATRGNGETETLLISDFGIRIANLRKKQAEVRGQRIEDRG